MNIADAPDCVDTAELLREDFRAAMRRLASTVAVITCHRDGEWAGITATSVTSLSLDPPSLLVCVNRGADIRHVIRQGISFTVNLLERKQVPVSIAFGGAALSAERFGFGKWRAGESGVPWLEDALAGGCVGNDRLHR
jgi:flavin reductase